MESCRETKHSLYPVLLNDVTEDQTILSLFDDILQCQIKIPSCYLVKFTIFVLIFVSAISALIFTLSILHFDNRGNEVTENHIFFFCLSTLLISNNILFFGKLISVTTVFIYIYIYLKIPFYLKLCTEPTLNLLFPFPATGMIDSDVNY